MERVGQSRELELSLLERNSHDVLEFFLLHQLMLQFGSDFLINGVQGLPGSIEDVVEEQLVVLAV